MSYTIYVSILVMLVESDYVNISAHYEAEVTDQRSVRLESNFLRELQFNLHLLPFICFDLILTAIVLIRLFVTSSRSFSLSFRWIVKFNFLSKL